MHNSNPNSLLPRFVWLTFVIMLYVYAFFSLPFLNMTLYVPPFFVLNDNVLSP